MQRFDGKLSLIFNYSLGFMILKIPFFFLLFILINTSIAQSYRNIPANGNLYFIDSLNYIFPIEPDSIKFENGDSVIYHFKSLRPSKYVSTIQWVGSYYNKRDDSWAGSKTIIKPNNVTIWFAKDKDSITIKNLTTLNGIWLVNRQRNTYGKVTHHVLTTFLGITDSVKYITIGHLNTVTSEVTGKEFWLSKSYGFIKMTDIYNFYTTSLAGVDGIYSYPYTGPIGNTTLFGSRLITGTKTKLTERMVNDFDVGDEFHKSGSYYMENLIINSKEINNQKDSVIYKAKSCGYTQYNSNHIYIKDYKIAFNNNITIKLPYRENGDIPFKYSPRSNAMYKLLLFKDQLLQEQVDCFKFWGCGDNDTALYVCPILRLESEIPCGAIIYEGRSYGFSFSLNLDDINVICYSSHYCFDYVKKGTKTWGTPHTFNCDTLYPRTILGINENNIHKLITLHPNPVSENLIIKSANTIQKVNFYNTKMQLVKGFDELNTEEVNLKMNGLPAGLYIVEVVLSDQRKAHYKVLKSD